MYPLRDLGAGRFSCSFCIVFASPRGVSRKPSQGSGRWCLVCKQIWEKMLGAGLLGGAADGEAMPWVPAVPGRAVEVLPVRHLGSQQGRRELETAAWLAPRAGRIGINPAKGRGCSFRRAAVFRECLDARAWGPQGVQGLARCSPGSCPSLVSPRGEATRGGCEGSSNSLLPRPQFHPSEAGPSRCVSVQCFEALSSRGENC